MPKVLIDGIEYQPKVETLVIGDDAMRRALKQLVSIQYFKEHHKAVRQAWNVLHTLSPDLARLVSEDPEAAYDLMCGDD